MASTASIRLQIRTCRSRRNACVLVINTLVGALLEIAIASIIPKPKPKIMLASFVIAVFLFSVI